MYYLQEHFHVPCYLELETQWLISRKILCRPIVFTTGDLDIGLKEPDWDPNENDGKNMISGIHGIQKSNCKEHHLRQKRGRALLCENECGYSE